MKSPNIHQISPPNEARNLTNSAHINLLSPRECRIHINHKTLSLIHPHSKHPPRLPLLEKERIRVPLDLHKIERINPAIFHRGREAPIPKRIPRKEMVEGLRYIFQLSLTLPPKPLLLKYPMITRTHDLTPYDSQPHNPSPHEQLIYSPQNKYILWKSTSHL